MIICDKCFKPIRGGEVCLCGTELDEFGEVYALHWHEWCEPADEIKG